MCVCVCVCTYIYIYIYIYIYKNSGVVCDPETEVVMRASTLDFHPY